MLTLFGILDTFARPLRNLHMKSSFRNLLFLTFLIISFNLPAHATGPVREKLLLDFGWRFHLGDAGTAEGDFGFGADESFAKAGEAGGPAVPEFNDSTWRIVNFPHDWAVELGFINMKNDAVRDHGYKPVGRLFPKSSVGWYRRSFSIPASDKGRRITVKFDGVFRDCMVWLNGHLLGRNLSGYSEFDFDITDYLNYGGKNVLVVRADASQYEGWFYEGAGIYRHVWLLKYHPLHIPLYGVFVSTTGSASSARVHIATNIRNEEDVPGPYTLTSTIMDHDGRSVTAASSKLNTLSPFKQDTIDNDLDISNPNLWDLESPYLYTLVSVVTSGKDTLDRVDTPFGIRSVRFDKDSGFFLNDKRVEIKGVCCHQDHAGVGSALPDRMQYYRIEKLKEMGVNAYRTSHNPPTSELLDACDRLGMLVMDENRYMGETPEFRKQFEKLILRDRNHPSVIIWSLGNEEWEIQNKDIGKGIAQSLKRIQQKLDPTRLCTYAGNNGNNYDGINSVVDVRGVNYVNIGDIEKYHKDHPEQPIWGSEEASTFCTRGIYANDTLRGYVSDYDVNKPGYGALAEEWWKWYSARPWATGAFVWTGFDYRGEPSPYDWPCISSHFGIMDVCGFPKNNYYYYQSWWTDKDVLHLAPHWNWKQHQQVNVWCQSNCDSVEFFLNKKSLGRKTMPVNSHLEWNVAFEPGTLEAKGWRKGKLITTSVETTGKPVSIRLSPDRQTIHANREDVCVVDVSVLDEKGREVPTANNLIHFEVNDKGQILGVGNGNPSSHEPDKCLDGGWKRELFNGRCQIIVQGTRSPGTITLRATSDGLQAATQSIHAQESDPRPYVAE